MAQFSGDSSMPFFWQSPQSFGLPAEDESMQLYPANAMTSTGYLEPLYETYDGSGSPIYQSMSNLSPPFHVDLQPPRFNVTWRWWEDEANVILRAFTAETMQQLVQFRLYPDDNLPRSILRCRNESSVINFLNKLLPAGDTTVVDQLTHYERVEKLLSLCSSSQFATRPWNWLPAIASNDFDYQSIARTMDEESYLQFRTVSFEDWVHYSLGYATQSVEWFLLQHSKLSDYLMNHFDAFPNQAHEYIHVEKVGAQLALLSEPIAK
ncbi:hypothetical protein AJ79_04447 [Helicocarpus griseus UAMH5409]|uniref:Uncharacterized protein n=1 Tax=Helicocarpus griseus UAMH5409 TaxID=1447875 RepID=A0A2B7XTQ4_9EURO|nr:hypothetical protein AJ79_04447 [Helicocarpus griseus UAMH5409]